MTNPEQFSAPRPSGNFILPPHGPNALKLDENRVQQVASDIGTRGMATEELQGVATRLARVNPLLSNIIVYTGEKIQRKGGDLRSFNRGAMLGEHLIGSASPNGTPLLGIENALNLHQNA